MKIAPPHAQTSLYAHGIYLWQARIQVFFSGCSDAPPHGCLQYFLYIQTHMAQMLIFTCPLNFIVVFSVPNQDFDQ